jgi:prophage antirepressor-like protein
MIVAEVEYSPLRKDTNTVQLFNFNNSEVRVVQIEGNPWFVAKDVILCFGLTISSVGNHVTKLDETEKQVLRRTPWYTPEYKESKENKEKADSKNQLLTDLGGAKMSSISLISESGLYKLVMRSDKPEAKSFQDWVTKVVLPAIPKVWLSMFCYREVFQRNTVDAA